jgi:microcystin-dependent protein
LGFDRYDYADIDAMAIDTTRYVLLSDKSTIFLLSTLLDAGDRWRWDYNDAPPSDAQWDTIQAFIDGTVANLMEKVMVGAILIWPDDNIPAGFLLCDGSEIAKADYPGLWDVLGTSYGVAVDPDDFVLPDLRGRVPVGQDGDGLGDTGGEAEHTLTVAEIPSHSHGYVAPVEAPVQAGAGAIGSVITSAATDNTGGGDAHNNMPPYQVFNFIIKF